jgi:hypothetical protein
MGAKFPIIIQNGKPHFRLSIVKNATQIVVAGGFTALMVPNRSKFAKFAMFTTSVSRS